MKSSVIRFLTLSFLLFFLSTVFLGPRLFGDDTLIPIDVLYDKDPTFRSYASTFFSSPPSNPLMGQDNTYQNYPFRDYVRSALRSGEIPLWNPYIGMGMPFLALDTPGVFEVISGVLGFLVPMDKMPNFVALAGLLVAGLGMIAFLRSQRLGIHASLFGAVAFAFSGWMISWLGRANFLAAAWMPWIFWSATRLIREMRPRDFALTALFTGLICTAGHFQTAFHILASLVFAIGFVLIQERRSFRRPEISAGLWLLALLVGVGIAAVAIIPFADFLRQAGPSQVGRGFQRHPLDLAGVLRYALLGDNAMIQWATPTLASAVSPRLFGDSEHGTTWWPLFNYTEVTIYIGLVPLFFFLFAVKSSKNDPSLRVWALLALMAAGTFCFWPVFNVVNVLPGFSLIDNGRLRLIFTFAATVLAAHGLDRFVETVRLSGGAGRGARSAALGFAAVAVLLPIVLFPALTLTRLYAPLNPFSAAAVYTALLRYSEGPVLFSVVGLVSAVVLLSGRKCSPGVFKSAAVAIAFLELFWVQHRFNPMMPSSFVFPETSAVAFLKKDPGLFRVSSAVVADVLPANTKLPYRLYDTDSYATLFIDRYKKLLDFSSLPTPFLTFRPADPSRMMNLIDLMNIKYFISPRPENLPPGARGDVFASDNRYRLVYDQDVRIYENTALLPRAFVIPGIQKITDDGAILQALVAPGFDPRKTVILEDPGAPDLPADPPRDGFAASARVETITSNRVVVEAETSRPAYLFLSEAYYPGWSATVDGVKTPVYRADYLFRAVFLREGRHEVILAFIPGIYRIAAVLSGLCLSVVGGTLVYALSSRR